MNKTLLFAPITKFEKDPDTGFVTTYGKMTGPDLDLDAQICDPKWLAKAVPEWFESGANVRQMHKPDAVGVGQELEQVGDDWWLKSLVVDPVACAKVENKVFTGYSIGIFNPKVTKDASAPGGRIVGGFIGETSLVDRPANPTAKFLVSKTVDGHLVEAGEWITKVDGVEEMLVDDESAEVPGDDADETVEVDLVGAARAALIELLEAETAELAAGTGGLSPVAILVRLLDDLSWFENCDAWDDEDHAVEAARGALKVALSNAHPSEEDTMKLATVADLVKVATSDTASDEDRAAVADLRKALGVDDISTSIDAVTTAADEATKIAAEALTKATAQEEALTKGLGRLAKVEEMAAPGGPTRTRPEADATAAAQLDYRINKAAEYRRTAERLNDRALADGYLKLADELDPPTLPKESHR